MWLPILLILLFAGCYNAAEAENVCKSIEINSLEDFQKLRNCTIVVGHVRIVNIQMDPSTVATMTTDSLTSSVMEITDYLLVHRVSGLQSLYSIFPQLTVIRGRDLLFDRYAFVVYENRNLLDLGLISLLRIQHGAIRIESNPLLCFVSTINWVYLLGNSTEQHFSLKNNKSPNQCPQCNITDLSDDEQINALHKRCWNLEFYQRKPSSSSSDLSKCPSTCGTRGCNVARVCCNSDCVTECSDVKCTTCAHLKFNQMCVESCTESYYEYNKRECISANRCRKYGLIPHAGLCVEKCPKNYKQSLNSSGQTSCSLICAGNFVAYTINDLDSLAGCVTIHGSLTIELKDIKTKIVDLERILVNIKEITGYLKITRSPQLLSLHFLRNLNTINGEELIDNKYALYVVDNHHLEQIWLPSQNVAILKGHIYFHLNPRLCYEKILQLETSSLRSAQKISIEDASPNSNGERVICGNGVRQLNATVEEFNSTAARLKVDPMSRDDMSVLLGYLHHYKEAPIKNVTLYDGRHGCGHDRWHMDISPNLNVRHVISNLKPNTQYAYFVKTLTMTDYHVQIVAYSNIQYFTTLPSKPSPVAKIYYHSFSSSQIIVHWWPPRFPNGLIEKYMISYEKVDNAEQNDKNYMLQSKMESSNENKCQCKINTMDPERSGAYPSDENFYSKEQIIYEEALPDLIYVSSLESNNFRTYTNTTQVNANSETKTKTITKMTEVETKTSMADTTLNRIRRKAADQKENHSSNDINKSSKDQSKDVDENKTKGELYFNNFNLELDMKALAQQDTGIEDFPILQPLPICPIPNPSVQYQLENACKPLEHFTGTEVPGHVHSYTLDNLEPEVVYRISIRACVADLKNGCGSETSILAETVSKDMEEFLKGIRKFK